MPSRLQLLQSWASVERSADSDVVARVALDEIDDLKLKLNVAEDEVRRLRAQLNAKETR